ncbi:MAG: 23S rRNA (uridine(2479)-2'-O)-methyltransferase [Parcubacteria group bacterium ADurb.Bin316]|nr:MAG: 23S rRNA (uridine(2479)-2'-O)-methyltransferase [Parcubacteria group bacterium ADurb.Bin316]HOZ55714.1 RNA methyltransferase [bacterium]
MIKITSSQNPKIKLAQKLFKSRERKKEDLMLIEGVAEITMAIESGVVIDTLFYCPAFGRQQILNQVKEDNVLELNRDLFTKISFRDNPDGFIALAKTKRLRLDEIKLSKNPLVIVLEKVEKPGNLGAILRSADAASADAVILADPRTDIFQPNVIRASLGTIFSVPVATATNDDVLAWLKKNTIKSFAAIIGAKSIYTKVEYTKPSAIIVGTEHEGLSQFWQKNTDEEVSIPMAGKIDSLNASVSTAVILFEAVRQRNR